MKSRKKFPHRKKSRRTSPRKNSFEDLPELAQPRQLWSRNNLIAAAELFEEIANKNPTNIHALADASRAAGALYQYEAAEAYLERAMEIAKEHPASLHLVGQSYRIIRRYQRAIEVFEKALKLNPGSPDTHLELAILYERSHNLERAAEHCVQRQALVPDDAESAFLHARVLRRQSDNARAESVLLPLVENRKIHWLTRGRVWSELAQIADSKGDYDEAWNRMLNGKKLLRNFARPAKEHRDQMVTPMRDLIDRVSASDFETWSAEDQQSDTSVPVLLTGLPRSGTTLLGQMLGGHDEVTNADEYDLFPRIIFPLLLTPHRPRDLTPELLSSIAPKRVLELRKRYQDGLKSALGSASDATTVVDKNPSLLPLVVPWMRLAGKQRLIVVLRDPRDILVSCMLAYMPLNDFSVDLLQLDRAVHRIEFEFESWQILRAKLPGSSWIETKYENVVDQPQSEIDRLFRWLDLDCSCSADAYMNTPVETAYSQSYADTTKPVYASSVGRWRDYEDKLGDYSSRLERLGKRFD